MARVTYGALVTNLTGSIGGVTFQHNSSGAIARLRSKQSLNPSLKQSDQQVLVAQLVSIWPTLSDADKITWHDLAAAHNHTSPWGVAKILNGFQWFMSCNLNNLSCGYPVITTAPAYASISPPNVFTLAADEDDFDINIAAGWNPGTSMILIYATPPLRQSTIKLRRSLFLLDSYTGGNINNRDIRVVYEALFNLTWSTFYTTAECNIIIRVKQVQHDTGMSSSFQSALLNII